MSQIIVPVDAFYVILEVAEYEIVTREVQSGRETQTRRERVETIRTTDSGWSQQSLQAAINGANEIWEQAEIRFIAPNPVERRFRPPGDSMRVDESAYQYLINQMPGRTGRISLLLVSRFARWDLGGQASRGTCILPSTLTAHNRGRVFAHEFGHLLGLGHLDTHGQDLQNLMRPGLVAGNQLRSDQIQTARDSQLAQRAAAAAAQARAAIAP